MQLPRGIRRFQYQTVSSVRPGRRVDGAAALAVAAVGLVVAVNSKALYNLMAAFIGQGDFGCSGNGGGGRERQNCRHLFAAASSDDRDRPFLVRPSVSHTSFELGGPSERASRLQIEKRWKFRS